MPNCFVGAPEPQRRICSVVITQQNSEDAASEEGRQGASTALERCQLPSRRRTRRSLGSSCTLRVGCDGIYNSHIPLSAQVLGWSVGDGKVPGPLANRQAPLAPTPSKSESNPRPSSSHISRPYYSLSSFLIGCRARRSSVEGSIEFYTCSSPMRDHFQEITSLPYAPCTCPCPVRWSLAAVRAVFPEAFSFSSIKSCQSRSCGTRLAYALVCDRLLTCVISSLKDQLCCSLFAI